MSFLDAEELEFKICHVHRGKIFGFAEPQRIGFPQWFSHWKNAQSLGKSRNMMIIMVGQWIFAAQLAYFWMWVRKTNRTVEPQLAKFIWTMELGETETTLTNHWFG